MKMINKKVAEQLVALYNQSVIPRKQKTVPTRPGITVPVTPLLDLAKVRDKTNSPIKFRFALFGPSEAAKELLDSIAA